MPPPNIHGLAIERTTISNLLVITVPAGRKTQGWSRGWRLQLNATAGFPELLATQRNEFFESELGTTRGLHITDRAQVISISSGRIYFAFVDLRLGPDFGVVFTAELGSMQAVVVPRGVGVGLQTTERNTGYTAETEAQPAVSSTVVSVDIADTALPIDWPIPLRSAALPVRQQRHARLEEISPVLPLKILVLGADGQLGRALQEVYAGDPTVEFASRSEIDLAKTDLLTVRNWTGYGAVINAAAFTAVDAAETSEGRAQAWEANVAGVSRLARTCSIYGMTLIHVSSDYVFDGAAEQPYCEDDPVCPVSVYGQTKAAGDSVVAMVARHYIIRTTWLVGDGSNFIRTMIKLGHSGINPSVVKDQKGRLTATADVARAIQHLHSTRADYGIYNLSSSGPSMSWADIARRVFVLAGYNPELITDTDSATFRSSRPGPIAERPANSVLDLRKIEATGFVPRHVDDWLPTYVLEATGRTGCRTEIG
ncbi:MAG: sugar nucleotide-binding protein [Mycobacterium kyogaense]|uniref:sugar nucleotide-binding protein n=1 Tax=Mycobacterium kyogaense TaxID=2212479 RepID=UPI002FF9326F